MMYREIMSISTSRSTAISRLLVRCAVLALFLTYGLSTHAQQKRTMVDQPVKDDSIPLFRGVQVMADLIGLGQLAFSNYGQYEVGVRVNLKDRYFPVLELGIGQADNNEITTGNHYKTSAPYGKIGIDFNVMKNKHDIYRLYGGVRFAYTSFKVDYEHPDVTDPVYGGTTPFSAYGVPAYYSWLEGVFGLDAKIWGPVHLGWSFRYHRRLLHDDGTMGNVWYVPGYGKQGNSRLGGTFNVMIEI